MDQFNYESTITQSSTAAQPYNSLTIANTINWSRAKKGIAKSMQKQSHVHHPLDHFCTPHTHHSTGAYCRLASRPISTTINKYQFRSKSV